MNTKKVFVAGGIFLAGLSFIVVIFGIFDSKNRPLPIVTYPLTITTGENGIATPTNLTNVTQGSSTEIIFTPAPGFKVKTVLVNGATTSTSSTLNLKNIQATTTVDVAFDAVNYVVKNNLVFWKGYFAGGVEASTFKVLADDFAKDRQGVFYATGERLPEADPETFVGLENGYCYDKNSVFWISKKIPGADLASFKSLKDGYASDKNQIYYFDNVMSGVDRGSFVALGGGYGKDKNHVYILGKILDDADLSFEYLNYSYAKDKHSIYVSGDIISGADLETFVILSPSYAKDKNSVYYRFEKIPKADTITFTVIPTNPGIEVAKDINVIYSAFNPIHELSPTSTKLYGDDFLADDKSVYFAGNKIVGIDASSFVFLGAGFSLDKNGLWSGTNFIKNTDKQDNYRYLGENYVTDGQMVYYGSKILADADPDSLVFLSGSYYAYDKNNVYYADKKIATSSNSVFVFSNAGGYAKTASEVFFDGVKIPSADAASFRVEYDDYNLHAVDKNQRYKNGVVVEIHGMDPNEYQKLISTENDI